MLRKTILLAILSEYESQQANIIIHEAASNGLTLLFKEHSILQPSKLDPDLEAVFGN